MPLFKLNEDYKGWKAGVTVRLCSQDHLEAMGRGIGVEVEEPKPEIEHDIIVKTQPKMSYTVKAKVVDVIKAEPKSIQPEEKQQPETMKPEKAPAKPQTFNARNRKQKGSGKKKK